MPHARLTEPALNDLDEIWSYIAEDNPTAATRLVERILDQAEVLADHPGRGRARDELSPGVRSYAMGNYVIFYRKTLRGIDIIRVLHGARDIYRIFEEDQ